MLFNEQGILDIDEMIAQEPSFQNIMADGVVTDEELRQQSERVIALLHETEQRFNDDDQQFIKTLFTETNVLSAIYRYYELQNLNQYGDV
jgi:flagellar biosynthesis regulator FlaF